jgi:excisionase family DNA binding protein
MKELGKLLTPEEVSEMVRISPATVRYWIRKGDMKAIKVGKKWMVREADLYDYLLQSENNRAVLSA